MSSAPRYVPHYTVEDYLQWQGDWELIDGVAIAMTPSPFGRHERIVANLVYELMACVEREGCDCRAYAGLDWIVSSDTVVRPDVMLVCGPQPERHLEKPPELVVEVLSPSTQLRDQVTKRQLYHQHGVEFYMLVDPETNSIELLQQGEAAYEPLDSAERLECRLASGCRITLAKDRVLR
ncbi:Uma2 family endonuclease [Candidatus Laterigemmans baculatus]|uniref:Uma2 family endonuclease n=1 Tax=Candidatus Laterigemmans baculatus TaxID=2770505 RepID=UPI0013D9B429|nr:Uma2 family endonuclease [Candidatus Laterigemmans baculatus]